MIDVLNAFKSLVKIEKVYTDNTIFKLHYRFTVMILVVFSILLTSKQYFGEPVNCDTDDKKDVLDTFCWIHGTFIVKNTLADGPVAGLGNDIVDERIPVKYYQWVSIIFCLQALMFYVPRYLWKNWESGRLQLLVTDLKGPLVSPKWNEEAKNNLVHYLLSGKFSHNLYAIRFAFCEVLNFLNVVTQIYLMDLLLFGEFSFYGIAVTTFSEPDPMRKIFPKLTKCTYFKYGPSGSRENRDALCILTLNILNEKLFLILWFWFSVLIILSFLALIYRAFVIICPKLRVYLLMAQARFICNKQARIIIEELTYGDFFVLYLVGKNVNPIIYKELVLAIHNFMSSKKKYNLKGAEKLEDV